MTTTTASNDIPVKTMRIPQELWDAFGETCKLLNSNRTEQVIRYMEWANRAAGTRAPRRRPGDQTAGSS